MSHKYHIAVRAISPRFSPIGKGTVMDWGEGCLRCTVCVKQQCPYGVFKQRDFDDHSLTDNIDSLCKNCFRCVQGCPRELVNKAPNPQYQYLGDNYWTKDIISTTWYQAETGKIPVSGAGYGGPFRGPGFDSIWTDMSEIVRPTRDGIHGREYISTTVDLGRKPLFLVLDEQGNLNLPVTSLVELPLPVILTEPTLGAGKPLLRLILARTAKALDTLVILPRQEINADLASLARHLIPQYPADSLDLNDPLLDQVRMIELFDFPGVMAVKEQLRLRYPKLVVSIKIPADAKAAARCQALAEAGAEVLHIYADNHAQGLGEARDKHIKDLIRQVHLSLVEAALRDAVTLVGSGGIALAEHVAKAIICGLDGVCVDFPLLVAMECRLCGRCAQGLSCPVKMDQQDPKRGIQRVVNLMGAWNNQLLEILGAMGIREVRRLRGEVGRAMFYEDMERETFTHLFAAPPKPEDLQRDT